MTRPPGYLIMTMALLCCTFSISRSMNLYDPSVFNDPEKPSVKQLLFNGRIWYNQYSKVFGDQFFLTSAYMKGSVTIKGVKYNDLDLKYDIANDELIMKSEMNPVIIMNKEMVDSFTLSSGIRTYKIINERIDTALIHPGYINIFYEGPTELLVKYSKKIQPLAVDGRSDLFYQETRMFIRRGDSQFRVESKKDLFKLLSDKKKEIKTFVRKNRQANVSLSRKDPDSIVPVLRYYDSISK